MTDAFFIKNLQVCSAEEYEILKDKKILVAGCGGLGGSVIELLARSGIGHLVLADGDSFEPSNMNRQILCTTETLGRKKAEAAAERVRSIDPEIDVLAVCHEISKENAAELLDGCDIAIDALDSVSARLLLEDACAEKQIPLIHGAVHGFALQTGICPPGGRMLHSLYAGKETAESSAGGIAMTVFACAAFEVSEAVKLLLDRPETLSGKLIFFDLLSKESQIVSFTK